MHKLIQVVSLSARRNIRAMTTFQRASSLKYSKFGEPQNVLVISQEVIENIKDDEVLVKVLAAPINPSDINTIQGKYPIKPRFPATGGNECVGEVLKIGSSVENLKPGDRVVPFTYGLGTWTSHAKFHEKDLFKISDKLSIANAATFTINPCTAYRMLKDFVWLQPGDVIIQNGANSAVGQAVHQLCKIWDIKSIGVVRNRPEIAEVRKYLKDLGATVVLTDDEVRKTDLFKTTLKKPRLALNCVGGKCAADIAHHLENKGVMVTYGGMSREPVAASTAALIFRNIKFVGFWITQWTMDHLHSPERTKMLDELREYMEDGRFRAPSHEMIPVSQYKEAMEATLDVKGFNNKKFILDFSNM